MIARFVGIPWKVGGRCFDGVDCYGLVWLWYREMLGITLPSHSEALAARERGLPGWKKIEPGEEDRNDVILFRQPDGSLHVGIVLEKGRLLHCPEGSRSLIERYRPSLLRGKAEIYRCMSC